MYLNNPTSLIIIYSLWSLLTFFPSQSISSPLPIADRLSCTTTALSASLIHHGSFFINKIFSNIDLLHNNNFHYIKTSRKENDYFLQVQNGNPKGLLQNYTSLYRSKSFWQKTLDIFLIAVNPILFMMAGIVIWSSFLKRKFKEQTDIIRNELADVKEMEEKLRKSEILFRHLAENVPVMMYALHSTGTVVFWNRECERTTGFFAEEVIGNKNCFDLIYPDKEYRGKVEKYIIENGNNYRNKESVITCKNGNKRFISWSSISDYAPVPDWYSWGIGVDVTDLKNAEEKRLLLENKILYLQKLESMGVLAGGIAHDFNNLLMGIMGNAELARMELEEETPVSSHLKEIEDASKRAAELCRQMLAFSGKGNFIMSPVDINLFFEEMEPMICSILPKNVDFVFSPRNEKIFIEADTTQIRQMIMNLVTNSLEAIGEKPGVISVNTGLMVYDRDYLSETWLHESLTGGEYAYLEISDTGTGMSQEIIDKIFDPFFSTKFIGRGLGLPVVLGIVRGHNGTIKVYSEPDHGTTVKILIPLSQVTRASETTNILDYWRGRGTILVVDDDAKVRTVAVNMLKKAGFQIISAENGIKAIDVFQMRKESIDCVLLDFSMPEMNGIQTFLELKKIDPSIRGILSSGYNEREIANRYAMDGFSGFLQKPYQSQKLYKVLKEVLHPF